MRTSIEIDDRLMREAMRCSGARTKKAAVETALQLLVRTYAQGAIAQHRGSEFIRRVPEGTHWVVHEKPGEVNGAIREFLGS